MSEAAKKRTSKDKLKAMVDQNVAVLDEERELEESVLSNTIENAHVRHALLRNRQYGDLPLTLIDPDPEQVRQVRTDGESFGELADSIREHGVIEPITVRWIAGAERFQIITGERRFRAAQRVGLETIPAIVRDLSDTKKAVHQLVENIQRENMNPIEEAKAFRRYLAATGQQMEELAKEIGKSKAYVSQVMGLLEHLSVEEQAELAAVSPAKLPGKSLILEALRADDEEIRRDILAGRLTRREARKKVAKKTKAAPGRKRFATKTFTLKEPAASVTVRLKQPELDEGLVILALETALEQLREQRPEEADAERKSN